MLPNYKKQIEAIKYPSQTLTTITAVNELNLQLSIYLLSILFPGAVVTGLGNTNF